MSTAADITTNRLWSNSLLSGQPRHAGQVRSTHQHRPLPLPTPHGLPPRRPVPVRLRVPWPDLKEKHGLLAVRDETLDVVEVGEQHVGDVTG
jgi:hypothetical protein